MDLIIWRHSEIERGVAARNAELTTKDRKQAKRVAVWLRERLPRNSTVSTNACRNGVDAALAVFPPLTLGRESMLAAAPASR